MGIINMDQVEETAKEENIEDPPSIRQDLVETASKFLQNASVVGSPEQVKRDFLLKKGLSESEIKAAFTQVGLPKPSSQPNYPPAPVHQVAQISFGSKLRDFLNILLLIGGFSYGVRYIWKKYVMRWIYGAIKEEKSPVDKLTETSNVILTTVNSMQKSMMSLESSIERYSNKLNEFTEQLKQVNFDNSREKNELKSEIQSVKGILLSSRSFPVSPAQSLLSASTGNGMNAIPSWQLEDSSDKSDKTDGSDPDLVKTPDVVDIKHDNSSSGGNSSSSEIEMINDDVNDDEIA